MRKLHFIFRMPGKLHRRRKPLVDPELDEYCAAAGLQYPPGLRQKAKRPEIKNEFRRDLLAEGKIQFANPIERFLVKRCRGDAGGELLAGELDSSHVRQIFIINYQIDAGVSEGQRFRVCLSAGGLPASLPGKRQLRRNEGTGNIDEYVPCFLSFTGL